MPFIDDLIRRANEQHASAEDAAEAVFGDLAQLSEEDYREAVTPLLQRHIKALQEIGFDTGTLSREEPQQLMRLIIAHAAARGEADEAGDALP